MARNGHPPGFKPFVAGRAHPRDGLEHADFPSAPPRGPQARHDGQAARTQLQLAVKTSPSLIQRYFIFAVRAGPPPPPATSARRFHPPKLWWKSHYMQGRTARDPFMFELIAAAGIPAQAGTASSLKQEAWPAAKQPPVHSLADTSQCPHLLTGRLQTQDVTKKLKDESGGMDLMGYIEFQRWVGAGGGGR